VLACTGADSDACLTPLQVEAVKRIYAGARTTSGHRLYPGWAPGSESGWGIYIINPREPVRAELFRGWVFRNRAWDPRSFDWDKDVAAVNAAYPFLSAMSTDYSAFNVLLPLLPRSGHGALWGRGGTEHVRPASSWLEYAQRAEPAHSLVGKSRRCRGGRLAKGGRPCLLH
jgi:hypothetical protein